MLRLQGDNEAKKQKKTHKQANERMSTKCTNSRDGGQQQRRESRPDRAQKGEQRKRKKK
jgi:hypothetical protein